MSIPRVTTADGFELEALLEGAAEPRGAVRRGSVVLCHPHPEHGGTMRAPILGAIARRARDRGLDVLRFNFRGIGSSQGTHGEGIAEVLDVDAAVSSLDDHPAPVIGIVGWSFGAVMALRWQAESGSTLRYVGIAPPVDGPLTPPLPGPHELLPADRLFIIGDRDQFIDANELEAYGRSIGASTLRYPTADHFFVLRHERLADDVVEGLLGPSEVGERGSVG